MDNIPNLFNNLEEFPLESVGCTVPVKEEELQKIFRGHEREVPRLALGKYERSLAC